MTQIYQAVDSITVCSVRKYGACVGVYREWQILCPDIKCSYDHFA